MARGFKGGISFLFKDIVEIPAAFNEPYFASLDGFRALSIIMVLGSHLHIPYHYFTSKFTNGGLGVNIFFVISGFLITTLLIREKVSAKDINLKRFYIRRFLRIFPVAYLYLITLILLNYIFKLEISPINLIAGALYILNLSYFRSHYYTWYTGHFWSLSVEEQFYLLFPVVLKKNFRIFISIVLFIILGLPVIIYLQYKIAFLNIGIFYAATHYLIKFQSIAVGCLFSILCLKNIINLNNIKKYKIPLNILGFFAIFFLGFSENFSLASVFNNLLIALITGLLIVSNLLRSEDWIFKLLNLKLVKTIGILSYSIYIWQQIFTSADSRLPHFLVSPPYNIIALIIISCISYYAFEKKFLKLKNKFENKK